VVRSLPRRALAGRARRDRGTALGRGPPARALGPRGRRALPARHRHDVGGAPPERRHLPRRRHRLASARRDHPQPQRLRARRPALAQRHVRERRAGRPRAAAQRRRGAHRQVPPELLQLAPRPSGGGLLMAAAAARGGSAASQATPLLSIGQVLSKLSGEFPALTSSKLRFLEVQGIVSPQRTASGYRKFAPSDVERLRLALTLQRDHYLPLSVIRDYLDDI